MTRPRLTVCIMRSVGSGRFVGIGLRALAELGQLETTAEYQRGLIHQILDRFVVDWLPTRRYGVKPVKGSHRFSGLGRRVSSGSFWRGRRVIVHSHLRGRRR